MSISIFAKRAFLNTSPNVEFESKEKSYKGNGHMMRVSSMIRGDQIADFIGAPLNPTKGYKNGVCIYVKPHVKAEEDFKFEGKKGRTYVDIIDGWGLIPLLEKYPKIHAIACSEQDVYKLRAAIPNKVFFIPQHHCNYDRAKRTRKGIKTIGVIGTEDAFPMLPEGLETELDKMGIKLLKYSKFFSRQDVVDFYKQIDVQIVWRPYRMRLSNPLKIVNASSFGIPTIAYEESVFHEMSGCYVPVNDLEDFIANLKEMIKFPKLYKKLSDACLIRAEEYHIEKVAERYRQL